MVHRAGDGAVCDTINIYVNINSGIGWRRSRYWRIKMLKPESIAFIKEVAERFGAEKILLFGSCLQKTQEEANDIDLLVYGLDVFKHWDMAREIMRAP